VQRGAAALARFEGSGVGLNFDNITILYQNYKVATALYMMFISFFVFLILGLYLEKVLPSAYGLRQPWYFIFQCSYWFPGSKKRAPIEHHSHPDDDNEEELEKKSVPEGNYEPVESNLVNLEKQNKILKVNNLHKTFDNGFKAVNGVSLKMYEGKIFALLGHNGAGKTTTISMLTGLIESTSGNASIYNYDLMNEMDKVRHIMGVCPQHDVLFELLTPEEHLDIFYDFKGADPKLKKDEIAKILKDVDVADRKDTIAK